MDLDNFENNFSNYQLLWHRNASNTAIVQTSSNTIPRHFLPGALADLQKERSDIPVGFPHKLLFGPPCPMKEEPKQKLPAFSPSSWELRL